MSRIRILIVEDEPLIAEDLRGHLEELGYAVVGTCDNALDAMSELATGTPDLLLLDINLGDGADGIQLAEKVNAKQGTPFVFVTSHSDQATLERVKAVRPAGFILKPFDENDLRTQIELALARHATHLEATEMPVEQERDQFVIADSVFVKEKNRLVKVPFSEILYAEAYDNYTKLFTAEHRFTVSATLKAVADRLAGPPFLRVHRSYLVNVGHITALEEGYVHIGRQRIPVGKTFREELMKHVRTL